jgi:hypothetical protein
MPTHVAVVFIKASMILPEVDAQGLLRTPAGQALSAEQKRLTAGLPIPIRSIPQPNSNPLFHLYATSEQDARAVGKAFVQWMNSNVQTRLQQARARLQTLEAENVAIEKELPELKTKAQSLDEQLAREGRAKDIPSTEYGQSARAEFRKTLDLLAVEIAGVKARREALTVRPSDLPPAVFEQMRIEQDVELAGLLARKKALEDRLAELRLFFELSDQLASTRKRISELSTNAPQRAQNLLAARNSLDAWKKVLENSSLGETQVRPVSRDKSIRAARPASPRPSAN